MTTAKVSKSRFVKPEDLLSRLEQLEAKVIERTKSDGQPPRPKTGDVEQRMAALEKAVARLLAESHEGEELEAAPLGYCALPPVPERVLAPDVSADRARLIRDNEKKWANGTRLHYYFFESGNWAGGPEQLEIVRQGFDVWRQLGIGITFEEVRDPAAAEVRIGFLRGDGSWSYVGRDVIDKAGQSERTMNFGWDLREDPRGVDVPVHEIGHSLGFPHEHQNPFAGIVWDEEAVYRYFAGPPNYWPRATTEFNVLRKLSPSEVSGTEWDPDSIMEYAFGAGLILEPEKFRSGLRPQGGLSHRDVAQVRKFYPPHDDAANPELKPFRSQPLKLAPSQQANFTIVPSASRDYTIQTFGRADTVMVLFEDHNGVPRYVDGHDDSGTPANSTLKARLTAGRKYTLRVRMYAPYGAGETAVMLW